MGPRWDKAGPSVAYIVPNHTVVNGNIMVDSITSALYSLSLDGAAVKEREYALWHFLKDLVGFP